MSQCHIKLVFDMLARTGIEPGKKLRHGVPDPRPCHPYENPWFYLQEPLTRRVLVVGKDLTLLSDFFFYVLCP